ncbi:MAG: ABC transporter permease [Campylobacterota bacterium]|nr:ABC transporter permease [Campylobacterota bacterium]
MFKLIVKTAFLSLLRRKLRTLLVIFMIAVSLWALLFMQGIYDGMYKQMVDNAIRSDSGHISLYAKGFKQEKSIEYQITNLEQIEKKLILNNNIKSYVKRVKSNGLAATAGYSNFASIYGIDLDKEKEYSKLDKYIYKGKFDFLKRSNGVIIGYGLAKKLKLKIGKKLIISSQDINNEINSISLKVSGILKTNNMALDKSAVFIDIKKAQRFFGIKGVSQISLIFNDTAYIKQFQNQLKKTYKDMDILRWDEQYPALLQSQQMMEQFSLISYGAVFFVATIGIFGVVLVSVLERLREFGILRAIGTKFSIVASIIFCESFIIGIAGFIAGVLFGGITLYYFHIYGLDLSSFSDALDQFGMDTVTYAVIKTKYFTMAFISVFTAMILSILIPLRILKKAKPTEMING